MSWSRGVVLLASVLALVASAACDEGGSGEDEARHRLVSDAELACLTAYDRDRLCLGEAVAGTPEAACPPEDAGTLYDTYGAECVRASIAAWECHGELGCSEAGCTVEEEALASACTTVVDGG